MKRPVLLLLGVMFAAGAAGFGVTCWRRTVGPMIQVPESLDLGVQTIGESVHVPIIVRNTGDAPLRLTAFQSSCACLAVTMTRDGLDVPVGEEVTIPPGEQASLLSGVRADGKSGATFRTRLRFATNDPRRPEVSIEFTAKLQGSVVAAPSEMALGNLLPGEVVTRKLQVRDVGRKAPFRLQAVRSNVPNIVTVIRTTHSLGGADENVAKIAEVVATHTAELKVTAPSQPGPFAGQLEVLEEGSPVVFLQVPITGRVVPRYQICPDSLVFPRQSASGPLYAAQCFCTSTSGKPFTLTLVNSPPGVTASVKKVNDSRHLIEVAADPASAKADSKPRRVSFQAAGATANETLSLSVLVVAPD